jgi:YVTN family beta-propeller protein
MKIFFNFLLIANVLLFASCASSEGIFPSVTLDTSETTVVLPNPISIVADTTNSQVVVANSNVDVLFDAGSLAVLTVDATDTTAPTLTAAHVLAAPNYATEIYFDGASDIFIPFRESLSSDASVDVLVKYQLSDGFIAGVSDFAVADDPFGITGTATQVYVVSDDVLSIFDVALTTSTTIDLTAAEDSIDSTDSTYAEDVVIDAINNIAVVSNRSGLMYIVDLATNTLSQVIDGPLSTRALSISGQTLFALDGNAESVWVFDLSLLSAAASTPESVEDSEILVTTIAVGNDPNGMALDAANNRLYVSNTFDDTVSVIDTVSLQEVARVSLDAEDISSSFVRDCEEPFGLTVGSFNTVSYLFVTCFKTHAIMMLHPSSLNVVEVFPNTAE